MTQLSESMLETNPTPALIDAHALAACIDACFACTQTCVSCADACLGEDDPGHLSRCIRLNNDCADICGVTGRILSRNQHSDLESVRKLVEACAIISQRCAEECEGHQTRHEHCRVCAEACRRALKACGEVLRHLAHTDESSPPLRPRH